MVINVLDMPFENLLRHFRPAIDFIAKAIKSGGVVLVHCYAGVSRSASVVIAYLMKELGLPALDAMTYVRKRRPIIFPNPGFQRQLFDFEKHLRATQSKVMNDYQERKKKKASEQMMMQMAYNSS
jgi:protein-tyrosine phosphatase